MGRLCCLFSLLLMIAPLHAGDLKTDEEIIYFATSGNRNTDNGTWRLPIHGWIFEAEHDSLWRQGVVAMLKQHLGLSPQSNGSQHLKERGWPFLVDNEGGKEVTVRIAGKTFRLSSSETNGHLYGEAQVKLEMENGERTRRWLQFDTVMPKRDARRFVGEIQLIPAKGLSVISDIDDTIKLTSVLDKEALLENTFLRDFQAIPGMAERYRRWDRTPGTAFHYVTGSPWQLYPSLMNFLADEGFPRGSFAMRHFRLKDDSFIDFLSSAEEYKVTTIDALLQRYPERHFILVGDSGEKDPEVYGKIARRYPERVAAIYIRNVTGESADDARFLKAFAAVPPNRWQLFSDAEGIRTSLY